MGLESRKELDPLHHVNHHDLSRAYFLFEDWENALQYAKSAQSLNVKFIFNDLMLVLIYTKLGRLEEAENVVADLDDSNNSYFLKLYIKAIVAIAKGESQKALSYIEQLAKEAENVDLSARIGRLYLELEMLEEAAYWYENAYENHDYRIVVFEEGGVTLPENLPDHSALQAALDKPELNALFEIRRKNLGLKQDVQ